ncbi:MAG: hypothetical protein E7271_04900 [Lachnospiraceae bacterium]|jgi:hypothetical protein|nr:hypothetical protein [Lachnospiraceae bacterium]
MADISISLGNSPAVHNYSTPTAVDKRVDISVTNAPEVTKDDDDKKVVLKEDYLEDVVAVSEDGDTLQVREEDTAKASYDLFEDEDLSSIDNDAVKLDRKVVAEEPKPIDDEKKEVELLPMFRDDDNEPVVEVSKPKVDTTTSNITSYAGYTDTQLKQMYLDGEISKYNYDKEMEARDEEKQNITSSNKDFSKEVMNTVSGMEKVSEDAEQIQIAFGNNSNQTPDPSTRVEIMSALQSVTNFQ